MPDSTILTDNLRYVSGNSPNNKKVAEILFKEQRKFCAYTDEYISRTDAKDIEHFNPTLKDSSEDNYYQLVFSKASMEQRKKLQMG